MPCLYDTAAACATELVSNAVKHAQWPSDPDERTLWLIMSLAGPYLLVEVCDPDRTLPVIGSRVDWDAFDWSADAGDRAGESGFGLFTVSERVRECGGQFGMVADDSGKTVFFALPMTAVPGQRCGPVDGALSAEPGGELAAGLAPGRRAPSSGVGFPPSVPHADG